MKKLETIRFGDTTFLRTPMLFLFDMPQLQTITMQMNSGYETRTIILTGGRGERVRRRSASDSEHRRGVAERRVSLQGPAESNHTE